MKSKIQKHIAIALLIPLSSALAAAPPVGAAPKGNATAVASRIIKNNFPTCRRIKSAVRAPDGSIRARCDATDYLVFTVFNAKEGRTLELAMNCSAAENILKVSC